MPSIDHRPENSRFIKENGIKHHSCDNCFRLHKGCIALPPNHLRRFRGIGLKKCSHCTSLSHPCFRTINGQRVDHSPLENDDGRSHTLSVSESSAPSSTSGVPHESGPSLLAATLPAVTRTLIEGNTNVYDPLLRDILPHRSFSEAYVRHQNLEGDALHDQKRGDGKESGHLKDPREAARPDYSTLEATLRQESTAARYQTTTHPIQPEVSPSEHSPHLITPLLSPSFHEKPGDEKDPRDVEILRLRIGVETAFSKVRELSLAHLEDNERLRREKEEELSHIRERHAALLEGMERGRDEVTSKVQNLQAEKYQLELEVQRLRGQLSMRMCESHQLM